MKPRHVILAASLVGAAWLALFDDKTPDDEIAQAVTGDARPAIAHDAARPVATAPAQEKTRRDVTLLVLQPRDQLIGGARTDARATAIFDSQSWMPAAAPPPPPPAPAPASAPPLPYTYLGKKVEDGSWEVYLAHGEQTYVVREKTVIEGIYQVQSIAPPVLLLTYLPLKQIHTISIGELD